VDIKGSSVDFHAITAVEDVAEGLTLAVGVESDMLLDLSVQLARESSEQSAAGEGVDLSIDVPLDLRLSSSISGLTGVVNGLDVLVHIVRPKIINERNYWSRLFQITSRLLGSLSPANACSDP
jgi:hypothetical protein